MASSDAFIVGESWISEHYFTTDGKQSFQQHVLERRKQWDQLESSPRSRVVGMLGQLAKALVGLDEADASSGAGMNAKELQHETVTTPLLDALGYGTGVHHSETEGPVTWLSTVGAQEPVAAIIEARNVAALEDLLVKDAETLHVPFERDGEAPVTSLARLLSTIVVIDEAPAYIVVLAGRWALLVDRDRWPEGRYLAIDVKLVAERNESKKGGEVDRLVAILAAESVLPDAENTVWWKTVQDESVKHTVGVSQDLREGVRLSIETIANDVVTRRAILGLDPVPAAEAQTLAKQALRFIYRVLFLLYAEASPELQVLPVGAAEFEEGYSLDRLRDLALVELVGDSAERTHFYDSLAVLFRLIDQGAEESAPEAHREGLTFNSLRADLFKAEAIGLITESKLSDGALQLVLARLLLSKAQKGRDRGFISYADLGINQLGAVYEGLMSYTGFFAEEDLHEVAPEGNAEKGSWVVPVTRSGHLGEQHFVKVNDPITGELRPVIHRAGSFVYRLSGRDRQISASYYTPEVLTRFTVSQALEELLTDQTTADEILQLSVCEPALGSGAFAIEAVRQLAEHYLDRKEAELGRRVDPDERSLELQKVKAYIALHQVYGVDLNATAVELAEISLWLDTMSAGLQAPWFGLRLRRGNSLIGARRAVFSREQIESKGWLSDVPRDLPIGKSISSEIHHFLLPADGWGSTVKAKEGKTFAADALKATSAWARSMRSKPTKTQLDRLQQLAVRVETLWEFAQRRLEIAEAEARRPIQLWGQDEVSTGSIRHSVSRNEIEASLGDENGAYRRLRRVMDVWCAMWFWPITEKLTDGAQPPNWTQWIDALQGLLGVPTLANTKGRNAGGEELGLPTGWQELGTAEEIDLAFANARLVDEVIDEHPWLTVAEHVAERQGFFHWELDFAPVFARGGFDLQVGNPPWVRPRSDVEALLAEGDPWWQLKAKSTAREDAEHRESALAVPGVAAGLIEANAEVAATAAFVGSTQMYPLLAGLAPDLYRCFMSRTWTNAKPAGSVGLIHPESHFTDEKAGLLRQATYRRLRRHWQFINELSLFEIHHLVFYGVHVYGKEQSPSFMQATSLYHPMTVDGSRKHDGSGTEPGLKDENGHWDTRPHASRVQHVDDSVLKTWHAVLEDERTPVPQTRMVYTVNRATAAVLEKLAIAPRIGELNLQFSVGWNETIDRKKGRFDSEWGAPESWDSVILQGPHIHVGNPFYKSPNESMKNNQDWTGVDLETLPADAIPVTQYKPRGNLSTYDAAYGTWGDTSIRDYYRIGWRNMAANTGERTLISTVIPPDAVHVDGVFSLGLPGDTRTLVLIAASMSSLLSDFLIRAAPKSTIRRGSASRLPQGWSPRFEEELLTRYLSLVCMTEAYSDLWRSVMFDGWKWECPVRNARDRRRAQLEIDVLVALSLGVTVDELVTIYRTQFPVLYKYDHEDYLFDANGRLVPTSIRQKWKKLGSPDSSAAFPDAERTEVHSGSGLSYKYDLPFAILDREADMRHAYAEFASMRSNRA